MGDLDQAIADCDKAVERGRELRADYKLVRLPVMLTFRVFAPGLRSCFDTLFQALCRVSSLCSFQSADLAHTRAKPRLQHGSRVRSRKAHVQVARALTRKGNALVKKGELPAAIETFNKALTEHRWVLSEVATLQRMRQVAYRLHMNRAVIAAVVAISQHNMWW